MVRGGAVRRVAIGGAELSRFWAVVALLCLVVRVFGGPAVAYADAETGPSKAIAIAYDNSGSMITNSNKWCEAKYSLEVLAAMLNPTDTLAVFTMENQEMKINISGNQSVEERVSAIHGADLGVSDYTEPRAARDALNYLKGTSAEEKYLVITTDGAFNRDGRLADVQAVADQCKAEGINVLYLAIGADAEIINGDPNAGVTVKTADANNILSAMTDIANQVFGRASLPDGALNPKDGKLELEVPMDQLIVFAQGRDVSLGELSSSDGESYKPAIASVRYSDRPSSNTKYDPFELDENLQGIVASFDDEMPSGAYDLAIEGVETVNVYYKPYVDIAIGLEDENGVSYTLEPDKDNELSAGTYEVSHWFQDPYTGEQIESELLQTEDFRVTVNQNGNVEASGDGESVSIDTGQATIMAYAEITGGATASQTYSNLTVIPAVVPLKVNIDGVPGSLDIAGLEDGAYPVTITAEDGAPLGQEVWDALQLTVEDSAGIPWTAEKSAEISTATIRPQYIDGDEWATQDHIFGLVGVNSAPAELTVSAESQGGNNVYRGSASKEISYGPSLLNTLGHTWYYLLALLIILYLIYKYATKRRLPKKMTIQLERNLKPTYDLSDTRKRKKVYPVSFKSTSVKNKYSPWGPEHVKITLNVTDADAKLARSFGFTNIGLVADKKVRGERRFKLDNETIKNLSAYRDDCQEGKDPRHFPDPEFNRSFNVDKNGKARMTTSMSRQSTLDFQGRDPEATDNGPASICEYKIHFKKVN